MGAILTWESSGTECLCCITRGKTASPGRTRLSVDEDLCLISKKREVTARDIVELENVALNHASNL
jgi:hypothetical protein